MVSLTLSLDAAGTKSTCHAWHGRAVQEGGRAAPSLPLRRDAGHGHAPTRLTVDGNATDALDEEHRQHGVEEPRRLRPRGHHVDELDG